MRHSGVTAETVRYATGSAAPCSCSRDLATSMVEWCSAPSLVRGRGRVGVGVRENRLGVRENRLGLELGSPVLVDAERGVHARLRLLHLSEVLVEQTWSG